MRVVWLYSLVTELVTEHVACSGGIAKPFTDYRNEQYMASQFGLTVVTERDAIVVTVSVAVFATAMCEGSVPVTVTSRQIIRKEISFVST